MRSWSVRMVTYEKIGALADSAIPSTGRTSTFRIEMRNETAKSEIPRVWCSGQFFKRYDNLDVLIVHADETSDNYPWPGYTFLRRLR